MRTPVSAGVPKMRLSLLDFIGCHAYQPTSSQAGSRTPRRLPRITEVPSLRSIQTAWPNDEFNLIGNHSVRYHLASLHIL